MAITLGITAVIVLAIGTVMSQFMQFQTATRMRADMDAFMSDLTMTMNQQQDKFIAGGKNGCTNALGGQSVSTTSTTTVNLVNLNEQPGNTINGSGSGTYNMINNRWLITSVQLVPIAAGAVGTIFSYNGTAELQDMIALLTVTAQNAQLNKMVRTMPLHVELAGGVIQSCTLTSAANTGQAIPLTHCVAGPAGGGPGFGPTIQYWSLEGSGLTTYYQCVTSTVSP
jgi:hypothetical protein